MIAVAALATVNFLAAQGKSKPPFVFQKADLRVLAECEELDHQFESRALVYHDAALETHLTDLASALLTAPAPDHVQWKFHILRDPTVRAFALPNGSVYVHSGLLARAENDEQVTALLAHEISHVTRRHGYLYIRTLRASAAGIEFASLGSAFRGVFAVPRLVDVLAGRPGQIGLSAAVIGYPRSDEREADQDAIQQLKQTGRNPAALVRLTLLVDANLDPEPVPFLTKDQLATQERIALLEKLTGVDKNPGPGTDGGYLGRMRPAILQNLQLDLDTRRFRSAVAGAQRMVTATPGDPVALFWLGESYRSLGPRGERPVDQPTPYDARVAYQRTVSRTEQEEANRLAGTPQGQAALAGNQQRAEELYRKAAAIDPTLPDPYFGLGSLYEQQGKKTQAVEAYRKYIDLAQQSVDKDRASRRVAELTTGGMQ